MKKVVRGEKIIIIMTTRSFFFAREMRTHEMLADSIYHQILILKIFIVPLMINQKVHRIIRHE